MIHGKKKTQQNKSEQQLKQETELSNKISEKMAEFFAIRKAPLPQDKQSFEKLVQFTTILMQLCPDITTIYNYRRQLMERLLSDTKEPQEKIKILGGQIKFLTKIIQDDPKSYTLWSYRQWLVLVFYELEKSILQKEKELCKMLLMKDEKNFHVWNYRNWANSISMDIDEELSFTKQKISTNPFNFSPYHFRYKYLIKKYNESVDESVRKEVIIYGMPKQIFDSELQMVKTALFLNPKEEAPWLYYSWILKQLVPALFLCQNNNQILFSLKVSEIDDIINKGKIENQQKNYPSNKWVLSDLPEEEKVQIFSNLEKVSKVKIQTGRRLIGSQKFDSSEIQCILETEKNFIKEVIESEENECRFGWLQVLEINKNILYLGTTKKKWQQIVNESIKLFQHIQSSGKGLKYIEKQKIYWQRLSTEDLSSIEKELKNYKQ